MGATTRPSTRNVFATVDSMDVDTITPLFAADSRVVFGNGQPLVGIDEIRTGITAFFDTIAGLRHEIVNEWNLGDDAIVEFKVSYDPQRRATGDHPVRHDLPYRCRRQDRRLPRLL